MIRSTRQRRASAVRGLLLGGLLTVSLMAATLPAGAATPGSPAVAAALVIQPTTTSLTLSTTTATYGSAVTATVNVAGEDSSPATGSVRLTWTNGTTDVILAGGTASYALPATLPAGNRTITASFLGDGGYEASTSPTAAALTVAKKATAVKATTTKVAYGRQTTITVTVTGGTGKVTLTKGTQGIAAKSLVSGKVSFLLSSTTPAGSSAYRVTYAGDGNHLGSTLPFTVTRSRINAGMSAKTATVSYGTAGRVTVTMTGAGAVPTGKVTAKLDGRGVTTATVRGGVAVLILPSGWSAGSKTLSLAYTGNTNYLPRSLGATQNIKRAAATVTIYPVATVDALHRAKVKIKVAGNGKLATGTVAVRSGDVLLGRGTLRDGVVTVTLPAMRAGTKTLRVSYSGSKNHLAASASRSAVVAKAKSFGNGTFKVNIQIAPGLYRSTIPAGKNCYWERSGSGEPAYFLARGYGLMQVLPGDTRVWSKDCGTWTQVSASTYLNLNDTMPGEGTFLVGKDVAPGNYVQDQEGCYVGLLTAATGRLSDTVNSGEIPTDYYLIVGPDAYAMEFLGCGTWYRYYGS